MEAERLRDRLQNLLKTQKPTLDGLVTHLAMDEVYGTFNAFSAAAVLRSEVFPKRSAVTPSYLAGHILVAELKAAKRRADSYSADGIRERAPRIAPIAHGVHSLMLFVEHLRARASQFKRISDQLERLAKLTDIRAAVPDLPDYAWSKVEDANVRMALTIISASCEECESLLLLTRAFFRTLESESRRLLQEGELLNAKMVKDAFVAAVRNQQARVAKELAEESNAGAKEPKSAAERQQDGYRFARAFGVGLYQSINQVAYGLRSVFACKDYEALKCGLETLMIGTCRLGRKHLGDLDDIGTPPSITDTARYRFVEDLITTFSEPSFVDWLKQERERKKERKKGSKIGVELKFLQPHDRNLIERLTDLYGRYGLEKSESSDPCEIIREFGRASIGQSVLNWWTSYGLSYFTLADRSNQPWLTPKSEDWLSLRQQSFVATKNLRDGLAQCDTLEGYRDALAVGAKEFEAVAGQIQGLLKRLTQWCQPRGRTLLLAARTGSTTVDPNELISALWIADRLGEPWRERFELEALRVVEMLQQKNGGFGSVEPLCHTRGFLFYPPSAQTLSALGSFVTRGVVGGSDPPAQERLKRWEKVLAAGTRFLHSELVGCRSDKFVGWQSDRHPEIDRIDCSVTTDAVIALCRAIDGYTALLNMEVVADFAMSWPTVRVSTAIPTDSSSGKNQLSSRLMSIVRDLRRRTGAYEFELHPLERTSIESRSLLFYGPPGTGKTYFQQLIAGELGWPLIVLTIADFLADGEDRVGARAREVFSRLSYLSNACIVFDEFDEMVLRRTEKYRHSGFDLLCPAMLPLLASLRTHAESHNCVVAFTTNYVERLDRAAKRIGRIDQEIPFIYHDFTARLWMYLEALDTAPNSLW